MQIQPGQNYTFHFSVNSNWFATGLGLEPLTGHFVDSITKAGFPVSILWDGVSQNINIHGEGTVDIAFTYNGIAADANDLGNAMQDSINADGAYQANFESADGGNTTTGLINQAVTATNDAASKVSAAVSTAVKNNATIVSIGLGAILIVVIAVYAFAKGAGEGLTS